VISNHYLPSNSNDRGVGNFSWWPRRDTVEWIQYDFKNEESISRSMVYWFDDGPDGDCRIPSSWKLFYDKDSVWIPVNNISKYEIAKDQFCTVLFDSISTKSVRLEIVLPKDHSSGIYKWFVE
jgi:hypothetical protein